jgi:hypothetical protein
MKSTVYDCTTGAHKTFSNYRDAGIYGQQHFGWFNFTVDTGDQIPSREEQLLREPEKQTKSRRKSLLESL